MIKGSNFRGGVHPRECFGGKTVTGAMEVRNMPPSSTVALMMSQHVGAPCKPVVSVGQRVRLGEKVGEPTSFMGAPVHASVSGTVRAIASRTAPNGTPVQSVIIENDGLDEWHPDLFPPDRTPLSSSPDELLAKIREAGLVGLGGAAFPTQIKLMPPADKPIDTVILNGAECEPYLTSDHRTMLEHAQDIFDGLLIAMHILNAKTGLIGIEKNKPDAIEAMRRALPAASVSVIPLKTKYPQGGEKQLIQVLTGRQVPSGRLPMDVGVVVMNVSSAAALSLALGTGRPLIDRVVTVTGLVEKPQNLRVRLGTAIGEILAQCGGPAPGAGKIVLGGPMMGMSAFDMSTPVIKGTSGILLLPDDTPKEKHIGNCIRCGNCVKVCPIHLMPLELYALSVRDLYDRLKKEHALDCIECGACAYGCPAKLPLVQAIRVAKREIAKKKS